MSRPTIGWYIHHHGHGHLARFLAIRPHLDADVVCFSTLQAPTPLPSRTTWIVLDRDDLAEADSDGLLHAPADGVPTASGLLHWAPLGHHGHRSRLARIAVETLRQHLAVFVVDVSAEVTLFVRLLGIPVVLVGQPGRRADEAHRIAFRAATRILAPWPEGLVAEPNFGHDVDVVHTGGISRHDGRPRAADETRSGVLVLLGSGGGNVSDDDLQALDDALPEETVTALGPGREWHDDPWHVLSSAEIVISWAGQNTIADLAAAGARGVVIPQQRPFDEQLEMGAALERAGLAVVERSWPEAWQWPAVIDRARAQDPDWPVWQTHGAAGRAAAAILDAALEWSR